MEDAEATLACLSDILLPSVRPETDRFHVSIGDRLTLIEDGKRLVQLKFDGSKWVKA